MLRCSFILYFMMPCSTLLMPRLPFTTIKAGEWSAKYDKIMRCYVIQTVVCVIEADINLLVLII